MKVCSKLLASIIATTLLSACGGDDNAVNINTQSQPNNAVVPLQYTQLDNNFQYVKEPLAEIKSNPLYSFNYWQTRNPLEIAGYKYRNQDVDGVYKLKEYTISHGFWKPDNMMEFVFNIDKNQWVRSEDDLNITEGLVGSQGIKTLHVQSDTGIKYYTLVEKDLSNLPLKDGITKGFAEGIRYPEVVDTQTFSNGAKAYNWIQDITQPVYKILHVHFIFSNSYELFPVNTCATVTNYCYSTANTLEKAIENQGWTSNSGEGLASVRISNANQATLTINKTKTEPEKNYVLSYKLVPASASVPKHILFSTNNSDVVSLLEQHFGLDNGSQLAWYEYEGKAVRGTFSAPAKGLKSNTYYYNKIAINDILTKWSPSLKPVLE